MNTEVADGASTVLWFKLSDQSEASYNWQNYDQGDAKKINSYVIALANKKSLTADCIIYVPSNNYFL